MYPISICRHLLWLLLLHLSAGALDLHSNRLVGTIPPEVSLISDMRKCLASYLFCGLFTKHDVTVASYASSLTHSSTFMHMHMST